MAIRNPNWARDELVLALDLYFDLGGAKSSSTPAVIELSRLLNALPIHSDRPDGEKFRNPAGVNLKLANFQALDPKNPTEGMARGGKLDKAVFERFVGHRDELKLITTALRKGAATGAGTVRNVARNSDRLRQSAAEVTARAASGRACRTGPLWVGDGPARTRVRRPL